MHYYYEIARIGIDIDIPFEITIKKESEEFIVDEVRNDLKVIFKGVESIEYDEGGYNEICQYYVNNMAYYCVTPHGKAYACVKREEKQLIVYYIKGMESYMNYSFNICDLLGLQSLLLSFNGLLLHSSFIQWHNQAILFSAPSGTGKSTQADLWVKYENAEIINGDRSGIRLIEGKWYAFGLPYAGSSYIYKNEGYCLKTIVVLRQAKENKIRRLNAREAFMYLYPELTIHRWDSQFVDKVIELMNKLLSDIHVYLLECLPDQGAVETLKEIIGGIEDD